jgi:PAS domain S-box-containing protein
MKDYDGEMMKVQDKTEKQLLKEIEHLEEHVIQLEKENEQFKIITENTSDNIAITTFDLKAKYLYVSPSIKTVLGYDSEDLLGHSFFEFIHPEDKTALLPLLKNYLGRKAKEIFKKDDSPISETIEFRFRNKAGEWRNMHSTVNVAGKNLLAVTRDITDRKKNEIELQDSKNRLAAIYNNASDLQILLEYGLDKKFRLLSVNQAYLNTANNFGLKLTEDDFINKTLEDVILNNLGLGREVLENTLEKYKQAAEAAENVNYNESIIVNNKVFHSEITLSPILDSDGNCQYILYNSHDITERKHAEKALMENKKLLQKIAENYPNSYVSIIEKDLSCGFTSGQEFKKQGLNPNDFIGLSLKEVFGEHEPIIKKHYLKTFAGEEQNFELFINDQYQNYKTIPLTNENGEIDRILAVVENITERKKAESEIIENDRILRNSQRIAKIGNWHLDIVSDEVFWSKEVLAMYGKGVDDVAPNNTEWKKMIHTDDWHRLTSHVNIAILGECDYNIEYRIRRFGSGEIRHIHSLGELVYENDIPVRLIGVDQDITDRKETEFELLESQNRYFNFISNSSEGICRIEMKEPVPIDLSEKELVKAINKNAVIAEVNAALAEMYGLQMEDMIDKPATDFAPDYGERASLVISRKDHHVRDVETVDVDKDGNIIHLSESFHGEIQDGKLIRLWGVQRDITETKKAQIELQESEERFRELVDTLNSGVAIYKVINDGKSGSDYIIQEFNEFSLKHEKMKKEEVVGKSLKDIRPNIDDYGLIDTFRKVWKTGEPTFFPAKIYVDEKYSNYYENRVFRLSSGEIVAVYDDVSIRENTFVKIKESQKRFDLAMKASQDGLFDWNLETNDIYYSPGWKSMLGYEYDEIPNDFSIWESNTHPDDVKLSWQMIEEVKSKQRDRFEIEFKMKHKDGHWVDILSRAEAVFDENNEAVRIIGTHVDITERKKAEEKIKRFSRIFEDSLNEIYLFEADTLKFVQVNNAAVQNLGYSIHELQGMTPLDIKPEFDEDDFAELIKPLVNGTKESIAFVTAHQRKDETYYDVEIHLQLLQYDHSKLFSAIVIDITERRKTEEELRQHRERLEELVKERTAELEIKNKRLEDFNKLFVGREFRIKELRTKVKELEEKLGI